MKKPAKLFWAIVAWSVFVLLVIYLALIAIMEAQPKPKTITTSAIIHWPEQTATHDPRVFVQFTNIGVCVTDRSGHAVWYADGKAHPVEITVEVIK